MEGDESGFDTAEALWKRLHDREGVWDFLRLFKAAWELPGPPAGGVDKAAAKRGIRVPAALREAYEHSGLLDPAKMYAENGILAFHWVDSPVAQTTWGIPLAADDWSDPPVVIDNGQDWQPYLDRLSLTCVDFALTAVIDQYDVLSGSCELPPDLAPAVAERFDRIPLPVLPMWADVDEPPVRWYSRPGRLLRTYGDDWMWLQVRTQTAADLESVHAALPAAPWRR